MKNNLNYTRLKVIIISFIFLVAGLILLFTYALYQQRLESWLTNILQELAAVFIISGTISVMSEFFTRNDYLSELFEVEKRLRSSFYTSENLGRLGNFGVVDCHPDGGKYDFSKFINDTETLIIFANDGKRWQSSNRHLLREHMMRPNSKTIFILLNPNGNYASVLANKIDTTVEYQIDKIKKSCNRLIDTYKDIPDTTKGDLTIYWIDLPVLNTIFFCDNLAIIGSFNNSRTRSLQPFLVASNINSKDSYYHFVQEDLRRLIQDPNTVCAFSAKNGKIKLISRDLTNQNISLQEKAI